MITVVDETQGCISVSVKVETKGSINTTPFGLNSYYEVISPKSYLEANIINNNSNINLHNIRYNSQIDIENKNDIQVSCGLVCGVDIGANVLYSSDGVLITIDGEYLIVQRE